MKILMVSIFAPHFFHWTEQLKDSGHEIYWIDVFDSNTQVNQLNFVHQINGWRYRINFPGRYRIKDRWPSLNNIINGFNERSFSLFFAKKLKEIKPDVVHSFVMHLSCLPIMDIMKKNNIKWIYSSWGSDLYYYKDDRNKALDIKRALKRIDYMFTDCNRDVQIARSMGFEGRSLGTFPGRGGFPLNNMEPHIKPLNEKESIIIKGYQGKHGRCLPVLKAIFELQEDLKDYKVIVFGGDQEVLDLKFLYPKIEIRPKISEKEVHKLMGEGIIYIGNSISDGMPNTLLEAIILGAFPIQSNPGGASGELIIHGLNGFLIEDPDDFHEIKRLIKKAISNPHIVQNGINYNFNEIKPRLERKAVKRKVLNAYSKVEENL